MNGPDDQNAMTTLVVGATGSNLHRAEGAIHVGFVRISRAFSPVLFLGRFSQGDALAELGRAVGAEDGEGGSSAIPPLFFVEVS